LWYSFCLIYDTKESSFRITINSFEALKIQSGKNFKDKIIKLKPPLELGSCKNMTLPPLSGQLTDLNIWSRPLNDDEIHQITANCNSEVVKLTAHPKFN
jgi:hypothetical protein